MQRNINYFKFIKINHRVRYWLFLITICQPLSGCAAKYHTVHNDHASNASDSGGVQGASDQNPQTNAPSEQVNNANSPNVNTDPNNNGNTKKVLVPPTAAIEVIVDGAPVTSVVAGQKFIMQPTETTFDPDDSGLANCRNPGITKARYNLDKQISVVERVNAECSLLSVETTLDTPGTYTVTLEVTSNEGELANSYMTLVVISPRTTLDDGDQGFVIVAKPLFVLVNQDISFEGKCLKAKNISWNFDDGTTMDGQTITHAYVQRGSYAVNASCTRADDSIVHAMVTIVIQEKLNDDVDINSKGQTLETFESKVPSGSGNSTGTSLPTGSATSTSTDTVPGTGTGTGSDNGTGTGSATGTGTGKCVPQDPMKSYFVCPT